LGLLEPDWQAPVLLALGGLERAAWQSWTTMRSSE
jgi:hypothetical protein